MVLARLLFSLLGWIFFFLSSAIIFPIAFLTWLLTLPFDRNHFALHMVTSAWSALYLWIHPGWKIRFEGRDKLPWNGKAILVPNHQSLVDALLMFSLFRPHKPVSRSDVQFVPFIGWNMLMNRYIRISRGDRKSIAKMAESCRYWIRRDVPVMIYPEGTRSRDGEIHEFKNGAFSLAYEEGCTIYPIVIDGSRDALSKNGFVLGLHAKIICRVLDPVAVPKHKASREQVAELRDRIRQMMITELTLIRSEAKARE